MDKLRQLQLIGKLQMVTHKAEENKITSKQEKLHITVQSTAAVNLVKPKRKEFITVKILYTIM